MALKTPPLTSEFTMHIEEKDGKEVLVCTVGKTVPLVGICNPDLLSHWICNPIKHIAHSKNVTSINPLPPA